MRGENIDVELVDLHVRIGRGHAGDPFVPIRHGVNNAVRLGRRGEVTFRTRLCQFEGKSQNPVDSLAAEDALLNDDFLIRAAIKPAADLGIFAFVVFAHYMEIDIARGSPRQRAWNAGQQSYRPEIYILTELASDRNQQPPQGDMIGNAGKSD